MKIFKMASSYSDTAVIDAIRTTRSHLLWQLWRISAEVISLKISQGENQKYIYFKERQFNTKY